MSSKRKIITLGVASVTAIFAAMFAKDFISSSRQEPQVVVQQQQVEQTEVLVTTRDVQIGERIQPAMLSWRKWPSSLLLPGMITRDSQPEAITELENARARMPMVAGEPVLEKKVMKQGNGGMMSSLLSKGMRAVAVKVSLESGAGGFIMPNDRVDVLVTRRIKNRTYTDPVLENVRVLAIDQIYMANDSDKAAVADLRTATLEVTPEQARVLARVQAIGELSLALRSLAERQNAGASEAMPRLSPLFAKNHGGEIRTFRYGVMGAQAVLN